RVPRGRDQRPGGVEGGELLHRPARGDGRHPGVGDLRLPPGGGPAARPRAASQGGRPSGALLLGGRPRHHRPGLRRPPPALPRRTGLRLPDHGRGRTPGGELSVSPPAGSSPASSGTATASATGPPPAPVTSTSGASWAAPTR